MNFEEKYNIMKIGGKILGEILKMLSHEAKEGINLKKLNNLAEELIYSYGAEPAFKGYRAPFAAKEYPYTLCASLNEIIVHGYPEENIYLKPGDVLKLDLGLKYQDYFLDSAITIFVEEAKEEVIYLIDITKKALKEVLRIIKPGIRTGDIGWKIESTIEDAGLSVIKDFFGHDIGEFLHGDLQIFNFGDPGQGKLIKEGMFFTLEPMASLGSGEIEKIDDYVFKTKDNSISSHFEVTLVVKENGAEVLTPII
mgnify:FL=1